MTYIDESEAIVKEVSQDAFDTISTVVNILSPDGRGFLQESKSDQELMEEYLQVRGSPDAWLEWINQSESMIVQQLLDKGVPADEVQAANPRDIANAFAIQWSVKSEELISGS